MRPKYHFLYSVRRMLRNRGYAIKTEQSYLHWIRCFIRYHKYRHPETMGQAEVTQFLNHLSADQNCSTGAQCAAMNSLAFLYNKFLDQPLSSMPFNMASKTLHTQVIGQRYAGTLSSLDTIREQSAQYVCGAAH